MSNERARSPSLEFDLRLSPSRTANSSELSTSASSSCLYSSSDPDSSVSSETNNEEIRSMVLVGCLRCLMYVLLSKDDPNPKCPKCKSTVLLDFLNDNKQRTPTKQSPSGCNSGGVRLS